MTDSEKSAQNDIRPSDGPRSVIPGLLSIGDKSRRKILESNRPPAGPRNAELNAQASLDMLAKLTYQNGRYYQGTTESEVSMWRREDMHPSKKQQSATQKFMELPRYASGPDKAKAEVEAKVAMEHLYFTQRKSRGGEPLTQGATEYAAMKASTDDPPKLLRTYFSKPALEELKMQVDGASRVGVRTAELIPNGYVLQSKESPVKVTRASEAFKQEYNTNTNLRQKLKIDTLITSSQAASMLREQQTPSPTDRFPRLTGKFARLDFRNAHVGGVPQGPSTEEEPPRVSNPKLVDLDKYFENRD